MTKVVVGQPVDVWPNGAFFSRSPMQPDVIDAAQPFAGTVVHVNSDESVNVVYQDHHGARHIAIALPVIEPTRFKKDSGDDGAWASAEVGWRPPKKKEEQAEPVEPSPLVPLELGAAKSD
jgi:hypothetical protein